MLSSDNLALVGKVVTLHRLERFELNGLNGHVESWDENSGRALVRVDGHGATLAIFPFNLQITGDRDVDADPPHRADIPLISGPLRLQKIRHDTNLAKEFEDIEDLVDGQVTATRHWH